MLKSSLPDAELVSLYSLGAIDKLAQAAALDIDQRVREISVFDPCSSRYDRAAQDSVRRILENYGYRLHPLEHERENTLCCGWGGQTMIANPGMSKASAERCAAQSGKPYITYCVNCRESIAGTGKPVRHILDVVLGINHERSEPLTHSKRRKNRETLHSEMTGAILNEQEKSPALYFGDALRLKMSYDWILEEDAYRTVMHCIEQKRVLWDEASKSFIGHRKAKHMTIWVQYKPEDAGYRLLNIYAHRITISY
jgi:hypothetical protein